MFPALCPVLAVQPSQQTVCLAGRVLGGAVWPWREGVGVLGVGGVVVTGLVDWVGRVVAIGMVDWVGEEVVGAVEGSAGLVFLVGRGE